MTVPAHIAIIMDGNGRWAREQGLLRVRGHEVGAEVVRKVTRECAKIGVQRLTLYAFSADNWKRPAREVNFLMKLLKKYVSGERGEMMENNIRFRTIGRVEKLTEDVQKEIEGTKELTRKNTGMILCLALSYGGRGEIVDAARKLSIDVRNGVIDPEMIDERTFSRYLYDPDAMDPDLLIRTGGDMRVSDFLLWQISYTELWVTPVRWPEFTIEMLHQAIRDFHTRDRRFGGIKDE